MQQWRNWHTRMIQVHVHITWVGVQVPSAALAPEFPVPFSFLRIFKKPLPGSSPAGAFSFFDPAGKRPASAFYVPEAFSFSRNAA